MKQVSSGEMFTIRFSSYQIFQYLLIFYVSSAVIAGQNVKKCAGYKEYCLNHWDCCSNSCMSYMYRCTRGNNIYPYPFLGISYKPVVTLEQILDENFGSYNAIPDAYQPKPNFVSRFGGGSDSTDDVAVTEPEIVTEEETTLKDSAVEPETSTVAEQQQLNGAVDETHRLNVFQIVQGNTKETAKAPPCKELGKKCFRPEECCSKRCLGYLNQCVT